ncbi:hypothetical protein [Chitinophaga alhagiae]|uniref:hypothetical protein n=1 Tax=Chitinophaga alhagiae TaxID=2203219 RepID=UPI001300879E|nr:hypothetical protein [Chitinophaga alhagiae]
MKKVGKILGFIVLGVACVALFGFAVMYLWNWLVPTLFAGPVITFWQALGLLLLSKLLLGFPHKHHEGGWASKRRKWKEKMKAKLEHMSPEERERMKEQLNRCMGPRWGSWMASEKDQDSNSRTQPFTGKPEETQE